MKRAFVLVLLCGSPALVAQPLTIVEVAAPAVNKVFSPSGVISLQDFSSPIRSTGYLQSRNFDGTAGAPAAGLRVYAYRVDLRKVVGMTHVPSITKLTVNFGPHVPLDFNGDGKVDDVFVITRGGIGNIGIESAIRSGNSITFTFDPAVAGGSRSAKGDSSFLFGLCSKFPRKAIDVSATAAPPPNVTVPAWAPKYLVLEPPKAKR